MRDYEVVYIFKSALGTEAIDARLQSYHEKILESDGSEITAVEHWGKRQLAYPIDRNESGYYVVAQFSTDPEALPEYERLLKLDEEVLRHLVVLSEGELAVPSSMQDDDEEPRGGRGDDDDDDDEDDGDDDDEDDGDDDDEDDGDDESDAEDDDEEVDED
jgi:small subunit ribosomal protein S6